MRRLPALALASLVVGVAACERDEIVSVDPGAAPGQSSTTVESILDVGGVSAWTDTVFGGFAGPAVAAFLWVEAGAPSFTSRAIFRFGAINDSLVLADTVSAITSFEEGRIILDIDTTRSSLASSGTRVQLRTVEQAWHVGSVTWEVAVDTPGVNELWTAGPGGTLGPVLAELDLTELPDSLLLPLAEKSDSLIRLWSDTTRVNTGLALVVADSGRIVAGPSARLRYEAVPELQPDTALEIQVLNTASTFILDPEAPPVLSQALRLGGLEGWRSAIEIVLPDSVSLLGSGRRARLRGSTVNRAELILTSLPPPDPFAAEIAFQVTAFELADDFRRFGAKTPVGDVISGSQFTIEPDSLDAGEVVTIDVTQRVQEFAAVPADSMALPLRILLRANTEAFTLGFWEFGGVGTDPDRQPVLRIVFTPEVEFRLP